MGDNMDINELHRYTGEFSKMIQDAKILNLRDGELLDNFINGGKIPVFYNGATLSTHTVKKRSNGEDYIAKRPYLICYNKRLGCKVLYPMTASTTKEKIDEKQNYQFVETPSSIYSFIESSVNNKFDSDTHTADSISTVNVSQGIPIFSEILDYSSIINPMDYSVAEFKSSEVGDVRSFLEKFYGGIYEDETTKTVHNGKDRYFMLVKTEKKNGEIQYNYQSCRPAIMYLALFINWTKQVIAERRLQDASQVDMMKPLLMDSCSVYVKYLQYIQKLEELRKTNSRVFNMYIEARNYSFGRPTRQEFVSDVMGKLSRYHLAPKVEANLKELLNLEGEIESEIKLVTNAIASYVNSLPIKVDMSTAPFAKDIFNALGEISTNRHAEEIMWTFSMENLSYIDQEYMRIKANNERIKTQREQEADRRRKERLKREQAQKTKAELVKANVEEAIKLYTQKFTGYFIRMQNSGLISDTAIKRADDLIGTYSSFVNGDNSIREMIEEETPTPIEEKILSGIMNITKFIPMIRSSKEDIESNARAFALEQFISGKTKEVAGESDESATSALELLNLIHTELHRARYTLKGKMADESFADGTYASIIQKALKQKDKFAQADLSPDSKAVSVYMKEVAEVEEASERIERIYGIVDTHKTAREAIKEIRKAYVALYMSANAVVESYSDELRKFIEHIIMPPRSLEEVVKNAEKDVYTLLTTQKVDLDHTSEMLNKLVEKVVTACAERQEMMLKFHHNFASYQKFLVDYAERCQFLKESAGELVEKVKSELGIPSDIGILDGCEFKGIKRHNYDNAKTGATEIEEDEFDDKITDTDLVDVFISRSIVQPAVYAKKLYSAVSDSETLEELSVKLSYIAENCEEWKNMLESDYAQVQELYAELLKVWLKLRDFPESLNTYRNLYLCNYRPVFKNGDRVLSREVEKGLQQLAKKSNSERFAEDKEFYDGVSWLLAKRLTEYVSNLPTRKGPEDQVSKRLTFDIVLSRLNFSSGNQKGYSLADVNRDMDGTYLSLAKLTQEDVNSNIGQVMQDQHLYKVFRHHVTPILFEVQYEVMLTAEYEGTIYNESDSKDDVIDKVMECESLCGLIEKIAGAGVTVSDSVYDYLVKGVKRIEEYRIKKSAQGASVVFSPLGVPKAYDSLYKNWSAKLGYIESIRKRMGNYVSGGVGIEKYSILDNILNNEDQDQD